MKGIIFDLDGVLVFTDNYHYQAWKMLADSLQLDFDEKKNNRLRGVSRMESLEILLEDAKTEYNEAEKLDFAKKKNTTYQQLLKQMSPQDVEEEIRATLVQLRARGYLLGIGSSSQNAGFILEKTDLRKYFDAVSDGNNIANSKPDPEVFIKAAEYLKLPVKECCVIEDALAGIQAAKNAGMKAVGMADAYGNINADYSIQHFSELLEIFQ